MKILLDTHVILWALTDDPRLSEEARGFISSPENIICFSVVSLWEIAMKNMKSPQKCPWHEDEIMKYCIAAGMEAIPVYPRHTLALRTLRIAEGEYLTNQDPFDRMLIAQAKTDQLLLLSHDSNLAHYQEDCIYRI